MRPSGPSHAVGPGLGPQRRGVEAEARQRPRPSCREWGASLRPLALPCQSLSRPGHRQAGVTAPTQCKGQREPRGSPAGRRAAAARRAGSTRPTPTMTMLPGAQAGRGRSSSSLPPPPSVEQLHRVEARGHAPWSVSRASAHSPSQAHWRQAAKRVESGGPGPGHTSPCASLHLVVTFRVMERHLRGGAHLTVPRCVCGGGGSAGPRGSWLSPAVGELSSLASWASPPLCSSFVRQEGSVTPAAPLAPAHEARGSAWRGPGSVAHPAAQPAPQGGLHAGPSHPFQQRRPLVHATPSSPRAVVTASG